MTDTTPGRALVGDIAEIEKANAAHHAIPVDLDHTSSAENAYQTLQTTLKAPVSVSGPGTFLGKAQRTLSFHPCARKGWWIERTDLPDSLPIRVSIENVWTTGEVVSNIVLRCGSPHNYLRMVEHIIALKVGLGLDQVLVRVDSGDPPLFDGGSKDLVDAIEQAELQTLETDAEYYTVREPVSVAGAYGSFVSLYPAPAGSRALTIDSSIDFPNAIGAQRIKFTLAPDIFTQGAVARTNTTLFKVIYCRTIGKLFADIRNLGYTTRNVVVAGKHSYVNEPRLLHEGKSLEAVWHRAVLDLLAAIALIGKGRFAGHIVSHKAGHALDCLMITRLYQEDLLERMS